MPAVTPLAPSPGKTNPAFKAWVESLLGGDLPTAIDEINAAIAAFNTNDLRGTSITSFAPNTLGSKVFATQSGKSWLPGQWVTFGYTSDGREYAAGPVQAYSGTSLTVDVQVVSGHDTARTSWQISFSPPVADLVGEHEVVVYAPAGYGATNTKIKRYSVVHENVGSNISYASDVTLGDTFTVNAAGTYRIERTDAYVSVTGYFGVSVNSTQLTSPINSIPFSDRFILGEVTGQNGLQSGGVTIDLLPGDVIRPHDSAGLDGGGSLTTFRMLRMR